MPVQSTADRFWSRVDQSSECWTWTGKTWRGYGQLSVKGRYQRAHRVSWELAYGSIPPGINILHRCDNPGCVRIDHLFAGTQQANVDDAISKGRHKWQHLLDHNEAIRKGTAPS